MITCIFFPENLGALSEQQRERFHQDIKDIEIRYQGQWTINMMEDYCWMLNLGIPETHTRGKVMCATSIEEKTQYKAFD